MEPLRLYRSLLKLTKRCGRPLQPVIDVFRRNKAETDSTKISRLLHEANDHLSFLRMISPRTNPHSPRNTGVFVVKDGEVVQGRARRISKQSFKDMRLDPDDIARHERLVRRQHFMDRE
eukprot:TRINITY_DN7159_c0_g1_i1.p1 TRINITY_DN7159_c0_g1~~TRINITY_DN7159_c0_g1_i1.p1  ORF type:complete len:119 (+),score=9.41 TRINITY_DN7159_c0_g1_i1:145-501(+)